MEDSETHVLRSTSSLLEHVASISGDSTCAKVLVIYSGGTIGMVTKGAGYEPAKNCLVQQLKRLPIFHCPDSQRLLVEEDHPEDFLYLQYSVKDRRRVVYRVLELDPILDSSNMAISDWIKLAGIIKENYDDYDGFVILHGTDTMAYSASALSFICENLGKPVILTGSQIPIFETRSDGRDNFLASLIIAGNFIIPEVMICFNQKVYRGNRCIKADSRSFSAFTSPNMPPLITMEIDIKVDWHAVYRPTAIEKLNIHTNMCPNVGLLRLFPGITTQTVRAFLQPPVQGVVLQTYGSGNAPNNRADLLQLFEEAVRWGVLILNISQCSKGNVGGGDYATGLALTRTGVIVGGDMTPEAALAKLSYVLGKEEWSLAQKKKMIARNLRGELSIVAEETLATSDSELINCVARYMSLSTSEEKGKVKDALYPCLMCAAAQTADIPALEKLRTSGGNLGAENQDGRTALHVACRIGHINVVHYLLNNGVSVHTKDYRSATPLIDAVEGCHFDIIKLLTQTGAVISVPKGQVAVKMCSAAAKNDTTMLESWLLAGADPDWSDYDKRTALHVAVTLQKKEVAQLLVSAGASTLVEDVFGYTPASIAQTLGQEHLLTVFPPSKRSNSISSSNNQSVENGTANSKSVENGTANT